MNYWNRSNYAKLNCLLDSKSANFSTRRCAEQCAMNRNFATCSLAWPVNPILLEAHALQLWLYSARSVCCSLSTDYPHKMIFHSLVRYDQRPKIGEGKIIGEVDMPLCGIRPCQKSQQIFPKRLSQRIFLTSWKFLQIKIIFHLWYHNI